MKHFIPRPTGPWFAAYKASGPRPGVMLSLGPTDIALSGGIPRLGGVLAAWRFAKPMHRLRPRKIQLSFQSPVIRERRPVRSETNSSAS